MIYLIEIVHIHDQCFGQLSWIFRTKSSRAISGKQPQEAVILDWLHMKWLGSSTWVLPSIGESMLRLFPLFALLICHSAVMDLRLSSRLIVFLCYASLGITAPCVRLPPPSVAKKRARYSSMTLEKKTAIANRKWPIASGGITWGEALSTAFLSPLRHNKGKFFNLLYSWDVSLVPAKSEESVSDCLYECWWCSCGFPRKDALCLDSARQGSKS